MNIYFHDYKYWLNAVEFEAECSVNLKEWASHGFDL